MIKNQVKRIQNQLITTGIIKFGSDWRKVTNFVKPKDKKIVKLIKSRCNYVKLKELS